MVNSPRIELVIWDWNGTLLDDTAVCFGIANDMRRERNMPTMPDLEAYRAVFGFPVIEYYRRMGYTFETESYEEISVEFLRLYRERVPLCPLQNGVRETLETVRQRGVRQVLLSATGQERLEEQLELFHLSECFERIIGNRDDFAHGKADYAHAFLLESGVLPEHTLFVGDTDHDFAVASAVGCRAALLVPGHQTRAHLESLGAPLLESLADVLALL